MSDERGLPPLQDPAHVDDWAAAYVDGRLSGAQRARFEAHLASHGECREQVELLRLALPLFDRVLAEAGPPRAASEWLAVADLAEARLKTAGHGRDEPAPPQPSRRKTPHAPGEKRAKAKPAKR